MKYIYSFIKGCLNQYFSIFSGVRDCVHYLDYEFTTVMKIVSFVSHLWVAYYIIIAYDNHWVRMGAYEETVSYIVCVCLLLCNPMCVDNYNELIIIWENRVINIRYY